MWSRHFTSFTPPPFSLTLPPSLFLPHPSSLTSFITSLYTLFSLTPFFFFSPLPSLSLPYTNTSLNLIHHTHPFIPLTYTFSSSTITLIYPYLYSPIPPSFSPILPPVSPSLPFANLRYQIHSIFYTYTRPSVFSPFVPYLNSMCISAGV